MNEYTATELAYKNGYEQGCKDSIKKFAKLLNEYLGCPCNFMFGDTDVSLYMYEQYGDWCDKNCGEMLEDNTLCWEMYLKAQLKEL